MATQTRFAPTPTGYLHPGNGVSFIITWALARAKGLGILLRIDDLDRVRCRTEYLDDIFYTIDWLGLEYDDGPQGVSDFHKHWSPCHRIDQYSELIDKLRSAGQLYACTCSRSNRRDVSTGSREACTCAGEDKPFDSTNTAWRMRVPPDTTVLCNEKGCHKPLAVDVLMGDFVVRHKDGLPAYQVASLVDDMFFSVDYIVRGADLLPSTAAQLYLSERLGLGAFLHTECYHHSLLLDESGAKLSKSKGAGSLRGWREGGKKAAGLFEKASDILGLPDYASGPEDLLNLLVAFAQNKSD